MDQPSPTAAARTLVRHFEPDVQEAFGRFQSSRSPEDANIVVLAVVRDHAPDPAAATADHDDLSLINDLNFDSVTIAEMVFFIEDLFEIRISNAEVVRLHTIGDLRNFVRDKLTSSPAS
ncbi:acyl carrier protein [Synoicihabitans lomoniglobus]|uniref:Acyl carrier protein n=1 Tax=Synoicihabitans lomoniglobus TaxID=2909285 RepID=A0AAE9ZUQ4_9BACT|nr:acyl carrier protein [Opitutaceae bacterium LMO-M01]WED64452.1 acyl carrier protein [Opitutaceae bacterium LMO-M01]